MLSVLSVSKSCQSMLCLEEMYLKGIRNQAFFFLQVDVEASSPPMKASSPPMTKADKSSVEEEQELRLIQDSVMERDSLAQNHSIMNGVEAEICSPKQAVGSNGIANSMTTDAFLMGDSSDSEGPLPEIDLGLSSEDESEEEI